MPNYLIYPKADGGVAVVIPTGEVPLEMVAQKDVPTGTPYKIISSEDLPADRFFRDAWEADFANPDGQGADFGIGSNQAVIAFSEDGQPVVDQRDEIQ